LSILIRPALLADLDQLVALEKTCFDTDQLSRRSFKHWITAEHRALLVAEQEKVISGYVLIIYHPGTRLARVYSLAVAPAQRGTGVAKLLMTAGEQAASDAGRLYLRLEVSVDNTPAIKLYQTLGYQKFGIYRDYYEDHKDALRYQKRIRRYRDTLQHRSVHWLRQTTPFTCGPASLMMAMHGLNRAYQPSQEEEINLWREATTIFMTSGHGGCHPIGLALAAKRRQFTVEVWVNQTGTLFIDGVRSEEKKTGCGTGRQLLQARGARARHQDTLRQYQPERPDQRVQVRGDTVDPDQHISNGSQKSPALGGDERLRRRLPVHARSGPRGRTAKRNRLPVYSYRLRGFRPDVQFRQEPAQDGGDYLAGVNRIRQIDKSPRTTAWMQEVEQRRSSCRDTKNTKFYLSFSSCDLRVFVSSW